MLKEFSVKALSILLTMCISSSMFAVSANALNNEKKGTESIPVQKSSQKSVSSESQTEDDCRADYMSKEQYSQPGFNSLQDPELFDENDTTNPLEGYKPSILSELYMGQGNHSKGDVCEAYILENAKDYNSLDIETFKKNKLSYSNQYKYDKANARGKRQYQTSTTRSIKLGDLSREDYIKDSIIQCSLFLDGNDDKKSKLGFLVYDYSKEKSGENKLEEKFERIEILDDKSKFVQDIEVQESSGYMGITVGDFDGDNYEDIAVYFSYRNNPKIGIFTQSKNENKPLFEWKYSVDLKSISSDFNCCKDTNRPLVSLSTTDISGSDDLVISVTMPYSNDHDFCKDGYTAIYKWENNQPVQKYCDKGEGSGGRMKFTSSATMDLDGDGNKELVIAANKNYNYSNKKSRGDMSKSENLVNIVLWENGSYCNAWSEPKIIEAIDWIKKDKDRKEPVAITGTRFNQNSEKATLFVEGVFYDFIPSTDGETANERIKNGKFNTNSKFDGSTGDNNAFVHLAVSASFVESDRLVEQTLVVIGDEYSGDKDKIYLDIYWCHFNGGSIKIECKNNDYFSKADEDDYATFFTLWPIDIDNDTTYMKYTGKTVGWSNPAVHSVMLSAPYWSELDYGSAMTARGSTSYSISTGTTNTTTGNWNLGLGISFAASFNVGVLGQHCSFGFNIDGAGQYVGSYQTSHTKTETLTFTSGGGEDYVALITVPIVSYHYDQWIPEHEVTEEEVEYYNGDGKCPSVGEVVPGEFKKMSVNVQLNPANSCIPVSDYNKVVEEFNRTAEDNYKLQTVDVDSLYAGRNPGDPSTYATDEFGISSLNKDDKESYSVSNNAAAVNVNGSSTTSIAMGEGSSSSTSNGFSFSLKLGATSSISFGVDVASIFVAKQTFKISGSVSLGGGCTWATANSENITYTTTFASLPESAKTETTSAGTASSAYAFTAKEVKWNPKELGSSNIQTVDGIELTNATSVIGCLVEGADAAPPKLPVDLHVSSTTNNSATLKWTNTVNYLRKPQSYKMYYSKSQTGNYSPVRENGKDVVISGEADSYTVNGLNENTTYYFKLQAYSTKDASGISSVFGPYAYGKTKGGSTEAIIVEQPLDLYKNIGEAPIFNINAASSNPENTLSYKWQKLVVGTYLAEWKDIEQEFGESSSFNAAYFAENGVINEANAKNLDKTVYRCIVTEHSKNGNDYSEVISRAAVLNIGGEQSYAFDKDENGKFIIKTYNDLVTLSQLVDYEYSLYGSADYILENNIVAPNDSEWTKGIGSAIYDKPFNGSFDGNGYIIFGLNVNNSGYGGLFERIGTKGIVKDLFVIDCDYNTTSEYAGGIAAINDGLIDHCISGIALTTGRTFDKNGQSIKLSDYNSNIKGVTSGGVAAVNNGNIKGCRNASVVAGTEVCGGITGINNEKGNIYGCASNITIGNSSSKLKGGLAGKNFGSIASSYTSAKISNATDENAGSIAGLNASENVKNVFYHTTNGIKAVGSNSTVIPDDTNKNKLKSEMLTKEFVDELNSVTDDSVEWIYNANTKLNNNYPTIKCDFYKQLSKNLENGIEIKGLMHSSLQINSKDFNANDENYKKLLSYAGNKNIVSSYNLTLTDSDGNYIPSNLWYLPGVEISVPVSSSNELSVVGITDDGEIKECEVLSINDGKLTFKSDNIASFALLSSNTSSQPNDSSKDNSINNSVVNTGDYNYSFVYILIISSIAVIVLTSWLRRRKVEKD